MPADAHTVRHTPQRLAQAPFPDPAALTLIWHSPGTKSVIHTSRPRTHPLLASCLCPAASTRIPPHGFLSWSERRRTHPASIVHLYRIPSYSHSSSIPASSTRHVQHPTPTTTLVMNPPFARLTISHQQCNAHLPSFLLLLRPFFFSFASTRVNPQHQWHADPLIRRGRAALTSTMPQSKTDRRGHTRMGMGQATLCNTSNRTREKKRRKPLPPRQKPHASANHASSHPSTAERRLHSSPTAASTSPTVLRPPCLVSRLAALFQDRGRDQRCHI